MKEFSRTLEGVGEPYFSISFYWCRTPVTFKQKVSDKFWAQVRLSYLAETFGK